MKHTPGPWKVQHRDRLCYMPDEVVVGTDSNPSQGVARMLGHRETRVANAEAIATLPDLLEAAWDALRTFENMTADMGTGYPKAVMDDLRTAIAKAEGREP